MTYEEALAKAKEFTSKDSCLPRSEAKRKEFEAEYARRLQFEAVFDEWLRVRGAETTDEETNEEADARCNHEDDLVHLILTTPSVYEWMIFRKFEVINYCITNNGEATWGEMMALTALDSIKADILRFGIMTEKKIEEELNASRNRAA